MRPDQVERYARHIVLKEIGGAGQAALLESRVVIVGAGGLGGPASLYLAAAGVGHIAIIDDDKVGLSNLQRQIQFDTHSLGQPKSIVLADKLRALNPDCVVGSRERRITKDNAVALLSGYDVILDGTDNFETRFIVNDTAIGLSTPLISGAVGRSDGQVGVFDLPGPCYRCWVPEVPPDAQTCSEVGIVGALTGLVGSVMAMEAIKLITGAGERLIGRIWLHDGLSAKSRTIDLPRDPDCPACRGV